MLGLTVLLLVPALASAHICIVSPDQRAGANITTAGNRACFHHGPPCGGIAPDARVAMTYTAGEQFLVKFQQNYNHYATGNPGSLDVAWAKGPNPKSDADFTILATLPDFNAHAQDNQQNFTLPLMAPAEPCDRCVIRLRYMSNKPGESTFYQCSDVAFKAATKKPVNAAATLLAVAHSEMESTSVVQRIDTTSGTSTNLVKLPYPVASAESKRARQYRRSAASSDAILDQLVAYDASTKTLVLGFDDSSMLSLFPSSVVVVKTDSLAITTHNITDLPGPMLQLIYVGAQLTVVCLRALLDQPGKFLLSVAPVDTSASTFRYDTTREVVGVPDDTFVNVQFVSASKDTVYVLMGDENAADSLNAKLFVARPGQTHLAAVQLNHDVWTIASAQVNPSNGDLVALSPGLHGETNWHLVTVDATTGAVAPVRPVSGIPDAFINYYGGLIYNGVSSTGVLFHSLSIQGEMESMIAAVPVNTAAGPVTFSPPTHSRHIFNMILED
jgi:hypothetical protein